MSQILLKFFGILLQFEARYWILGIFDNLFGLFSHLVVLKRILQLTSSIPQFSLVGENLIKMINKTSNINT